MTETQETLIRKIKLMGEWIELHIKDDDIIRMNAKERREHIDSIANVSKAKENALAILNFFKRGQVFDMPKEVLK